MKSKFFLILCFTIFATFAFAQAPQTLTYQGKLTDASGNAIEGSVALKFKLYDASSGGNLLWEESQQVEAIDGLVNVILGSVTPLALSFGQPLWLSISVDAGSELEPRTELTSAVSSFYASTIADSSVTDSKIGNDTVVRSLNGLRDDVMLMAGNNVTIDKQGDNLVISATGTGGADGLDGHRAVAPWLAGLLAPGGAVFLEIGAGQGPAVAAIVRRHGLQHVETMCDLGGIPRCPVAAPGTRRNGRKKGLESGAIPATVDLG